MYREFANAVMTQAASASRRTKTLLLAGIFLSAVAFVTISHVFRIPDCADFSGSLLAQSSPVVSILIVAVTLLGCVLISTLIAGTVRFDAGLLCGLIGMSALSMRSGVMGDVLRQSSSTGPTLFIHFALELVVLYALVAVAWSLLWGMHVGGRLKADEFRDGVEDTDEPFPFKASALAMQVGVMVVCILLFGQTDAKAQIIASVGFSGFLGACAAYYMYPISPSPWLWVGPMVVGIIGYVVAYLSIGAGDEWKTGHLTFSLAPLARALPLDYATAGPAGAILGYWLSRKWHRQRIDESAAAESTEPS
jgi:hypothetical protein